MPAIHRTCPTCKTARIASPATRCRACARLLDKQRGSPTARGLGYAYQKKRERIMRRDSYTCWRCGAPATTIDHYVPRSRGGTNDDSTSAPHARVATSDADDFVSFVQALGEPRVHELFEYTPGEAMTILHGTCLVNGQHPPGSPYAAECPVLRRAARAASRRKGWETRRIKDGSQNAPQRRTRAS